MRECGVQAHMHPDRLLEIVGAPFACLFLILILCIFALQRPATTGIMIPTMQKRDVPLSNCEFNGFTIYLRADGKLAVDSPDDVIARDVVLSEVGEAQNDVQDGTFYVIAHPRASYGQVFDLVAEINRIAPAVGIALVTPAGQVKAANGGKSVPYVNRCQYVWPTVAGEPRWQPPQPIAPRWPRYHLAGAD